MVISHILITRPRAEALELAEQLSAFELEPIFMPAYDFYPTKIFSNQIKQLREAADQTPAPLLIFTSPRAVEYGLEQIPAEVRQLFRFAAIGPSTAQLLRNLEPNAQLFVSGGFTSEDLLSTLATEASSEAAGAVFIVAAPGGRTTLVDELHNAGRETHMLMVYGRKPAELDPEAITAIEQAPKLLSVWTSANSMNSLSQRLPPNCWYRLCRGEWLVTSERLMRVARAFSPSRIHLTAGPVNQDIAAAVRSLV